MLAVYDSTKEKTDKNMSGWYFIATSIMLGLIFIALKYWFNEIGEEEEEEEVD